MTVTLVWTCNTCASTFERVLGAPGGLSTPVGWAVERIGDEYEHACPACLATAEQPPPRGQLKRR